MEAVTTAGGRAILKVSSRAESVERAFYRAVLSPLLPALLAEGEAGDTDWLVLEYVDGQPEDWTGLSDEAIRRRAMELNAQFQSFADAPVFLDWSAYEAFAVDFLGEISPLVGHGGRGSITGEELDRLKEWAEGPARSLWEEETGLIHGDLKADNLLAGDRLTVLDWQRPMRAPLPLEGALALTLTGREDPTPFGRLACAAEARWFAWAYRACLPYPFVLGQAIRYARAAIR